MSFRRSMIHVAGAASFVLLFAAPSAAQSPMVPPKLLEHAEAPYPPSKVAEHVEADVIVVAYVEPDGSVSDPRVTESGGAAFDESALATVRTWRFIPAMVGGKPVRKSVKLRFHFTPPDVPAAPPAPPAQAPAAAAAPTAPATPEAAPPGPGPSPPATHAEHGAPLVVDAVAPSRQPAVSTSVFDIAPRQLANVPRPQGAIGLLTLAPGFMLTNEGGAGHAEQVFLRGFDAREGQDLEFSVNGVPFNESGNLHGNGYADAHFIIPELVESVRVTEGPFDPRQGNFAVAGSADYELGLAQRGLTAKLTVGQFNTQRMLLLWGPRDESNRTFAGVELYRTDGFGQNRDAKRASAIGQYEGRIGSSALFRITGQAYIDNYHSAGLVREDDYEAGRVGFYGTYDPLQGGSGSRYSLAADVEAKSGETIFKQQVFVVYRGMRLLENFTGFLLDVQTPFQSPHGQRGDLIDLDMTEITAGARGSAKLKGEVFGQKQELEFGYFARGDHVDGTQQRIEAATGHPYQTDADLTSKIGDLGLYADALFHPGVPWITLQGGVRADLLAYDVLNNCAVQTVAHPSPANPPGDASCLSQEDMGNYRLPVQRATTSSIALMPRGTLRFGPFKGFNLSASVGRGVRSVDPSYITQDVATPFSSILSYETGVSYARDLGVVSVTAKSIAFQTKVDQDLVFSETAGRNILGGGTTRTGWVGAVRLGGDHFDVNASATLVKATFDGTPPAFSTNAAGAQVMTAFNDKGLLVPYIPDLVVRLDGALFGNFPWKLLDTPFRGNLSAGFDYVGHRPLPYGQVSDVRATVDAAGSIGWSHYDVGVSATNLFNQQYRLGEYVYASDFHSQSAPTLVPMRHFSAGAPRTILATFSVNLGGG